MKALDSRIHVFVRSVAGIHLELCEDGGVFRDGTESPEKPWHVCDDVVFVSGMKEYLADS